MRFGLLMVVRNEAENLRELLHEIQHMVSEIKIVDTGSIDDTVAVLREEYGIEPIEYEPPADQQFDLVAARNSALSEMRSEWVLTLDADERISSEALALLAANEPPDDVSGLFFRWMDHRYGKPIEDYKLFAFRNDRNIGFMGKVHAVPQSSLRANSQTAEFLPCISVDHFPDASRTEHRNGYLEQMGRGIDEDNSWHRYHWFLGYTLYRRFGDMGGAVKHLQTAAHGRSERFPVESLNAAMVLCEIFAKDGDRRSCRKLIDQALAFFNAVRDDFEVRANVRLLPWFLEARDNSRRGDYERVRAYPFAF